MHVDSNGYIYATGGGLSISTDGGISFINKTTADGLSASVVVGVYIGCLDMFMRRHLMVYISR